MNIFLHYALIYDIIFFARAHFFTKKIASEDTQKIPQKLCRQKQNSAHFAEAFVIGLFQ